MDLSSYRFAKEHEWARKDNDLIIVGISDFAQSELGDVVFIELPSVGTEVTQGVPFGQIESVKAASDLYSPVTGDVAEINEGLQTQPELVNKSNYEKGWMIKIRPSDPAEFDQLISQAEYENFTAGK